jgi:hypothetical protein
MGHVGYQDICFCAVFKIKNMLIDQNEPKKDIPEKLGFKKVPIFFRRKSIILA